MILCIPTLGSEGLEAKVSGHFGSAPYFTFFDVDKAKVDVIANSRSNHEQAHCDPFTLVKEGQADSVIVKGMGQGAYQRLSATGIRICLAKGQSVKDVVEAYQTGQLQEFTLENAHIGSGHQH